MEAYLQAIRCNVWFLVFDGDTSTDEFRKCNLKAISTIISAFPDSVKFDIGPCSSTKRLWEKIQNLHTGQDKDDDNNVSKFKKSLRFNNLTIMMKKN